MKNDFSDNYMPHTASPEELTMHAIAAEVIKARLKFPGNRFVFTALVEEVGELARAIIQRKDRDAIEREAIQVAAMCVRIIEEGDPIYNDVTDAEAKP